MSRNKFVFGLVYGDFCIYFIGEDVKYFVCWNYISSIFFGQYIVVKDGIFVKKRSVSLIKCILIMIYLLDF